MNKPLLATQSQPLLQSLDDAALASREAAVASSQLPDPGLKPGFVMFTAAGFALGALYGTAWGFWSKKL